MRQEPERAFPGSPAETITEGYSSRPHTGVRSTDAGRCSCATSLGVPSGREGGERIGDLLTSFPTGGTTAVF
jgi:hypothetical protein